jgi:hypothetical protein
MTAAFCFRSVDGEEEMDERTARMWAEKRKQQARQARRQALAWDLRQRDEEKRQEAIEDQKRDAVCLSTRLFFCLVRSHVSGLNARFPPFH